MADPIVFDVTNPSTWIPSIAAGGIGIYWLVRLFRRDSRDDKQEKQIDEAVQQIITNLRNEVERLTVRMTVMEKEIVRLHQERAAYYEERAALLAKCSHCETGANQQQLL